MGGHQRVILALVLCASGVVVGTGSRASTLMVSPTGKPSALGRGVDQVVLTDVMSPPIMQRSCDKGAFRCSWSGRP